MGALLRRAAFAAIEALVGSRARALGVCRSFGDDALAYFTERLDPAITRQAVITAVHEAKRHKAFDDCPFIGLALDGTGAGRSQEKGCELCRPVRNPQREILGYHHKLVMISVVGTGLTLPLDVEPYGPGDSEYSAGRRLLPRAVAQPGSPFCRLRGRRWRICSRSLSARRRGPGTLRRRPLEEQSPRIVCHRPEEVSPPSLPIKSSAMVKDWVEIWDADDFDPWPTLRWETVRVVRYRQHKPDGRVCEAYWLTDFLRRRVGSRAIFRMAKSRWEIENQGFNQAKNRYGFEHICHHEAHSLLVVWLLTCLALTVERLYRVRYLHRGTHPILQAITLWQLLWLSLSRPIPNDSS